MKEKAKHKYKIGCWYHSENTWKFDTHYASVYIMKLLESFTDSNNKETVRIKFYPIDKDLGEKFQLSYLWEYLDNETNFRKITKKEAFLYIL